ncbi:hypothetical protein RND71_041053 [Anisodus tanguticus]|uniref:FAF domain-containing protein n=1 Tax=Anisodus tanguticus TaxID=243964 RepID=A0AAE1QU69_9SOLA|nr:hypothetical protein RND71_041053 [Anisodus tanguticus]
MTPSATSAIAVQKKDPGGIGFLDEVGGSVDGLMSCTETLGFESSDERSVDDQIEDHHDIDLVTRKSYCTNNNMAASTNNSRCWQKTNLEKKEKKKFPPPLSSLSQDGKPNFYLRAVRKDGRLELTEVKISRPEILFASRQDGRLRLHLIHNLEEEAEEENDDFPAETEEHPYDDEMMETIYESDEEINDEEEEVAEWKLTMTSCGSGDGHRRFYGAHHGHGHNNNHHHDLHVWRQPCVTTR